MLDTINTNRIDGSSKIEINFLRLLNRCENMTRNKISGTDWRLEQYLHVLTDYLSQLKKMTASKPRPEDLIDYSKRIEFLKGLLKIEKLPTSSLKSFAVDLLVPSKQTSILYDNNSSSSANNTNNDDIANQYRHKAATGHHLHSETKAYIQQDMRNELFGIELSPVRHRNIKLLDQDIAGGIRKSVEEEAKYHKQMQEKLADEMVNLTRNLKHNAKLAGQIVQDDKEKLVKTSTQAEDNLIRLKFESERLEQHVRNACSCWIWITLLVVIFTFIWMVIFMKMFPKK